MTPEPETPSDGELVNSLVVGKESYVFMTSLKARLEMSKNQSIIFTNECDFFRKYIQNFFFTDLLVFD